MAVVQTSPIVRHATTAKRVLAALQQHADATASLIGGDAPAEFFTALEERDQLLGELNGIVAAITREPVKTARDQQVRMTVIQEIVDAAATTLASHQQLVARMQRERDRLADAVERSSKPDTVAKQYSGYGAARSAGLSVTG